MAAVAHGWKPSNFKGPTAAVAKEFNQADKGSKLLSDAMRKKKPKKAIGGPLRLMGRQPGPMMAGRMLGRGNIGPIATADRTLRDAQSRLSMIPNARRAIGPQPPRGLAG